MTDDELPMTVAEYARIVRKQPVTIRRLCFAGKIKGAVRVGGNWLIPQSAVPKGLLEVRGETKRERSRRARAAAGRIAAV